MDEKNKLKEEIEELKKQQAELREKLKQIELREMIASNDRKDILSRIQNKYLLNYISPIYDNLRDEKRSHALTGKVVLRRSKHIPIEFSKIRDLAKTITNYTEFRRMSDGYVTQTIIKRSLKALDDEEFDYVAKCVEEIIDVLYKYKKLCEQHQNKDYSEFVIERED